MRDLMIHTVIWVVAYFLTGLSWVTRDAKEPVFNRPSYLKTTGGAVRVMLGWPLVVFLPLSRARAFSHAVLFAIIGGIGEIIGLAL
jgi:hypothetical protein